MPDPDDVTQLLSSLSAGDSKAEEQLLPLVYDKLRSLAKYYMRQEPLGHTLQTTALVHEAYLKLGGKRDISWQDRSHFMKAAAQAMRRILVDHARNKGTLKKGGNRDRVPLNDEIAGIYGDSPLDLLAIDSLLEELAKVDQRMVQVVELRFFAGLTVEDTAKSLDISPRTVKNEWRMAKAWLLEKIN